MKNIPVDIFYQGDLDTVKIRIKNLLTHVVPDPFPSFLLRLGVDSFGPEVVGLLRVVAGARLDDGQGTGSRFRGLAVLKALRDLKARVR